ncbi:MAG: cytochrome P460 family protein [Planctomycetes bacterium]|nr:cytochrome P460 family protein [Planctomycetota bacterium]
MRLTYCLIAACALCAIAACAAKPEPEPAKPQPEAKPDPAPEPDEIELWRDQLLAVAQEYRGYTRLADDPAYAPEMCRAPNPTKAFLSEAEQKSAHGRKLYFLWVKHADTYNWTEDGTLDKDGGPARKMPVQPVGQVFVKESFHPKAGSDKQSRELGDKSALFVMLRLDPATQGTDNGWVYGTLDADGSTVTGAGKMKSCMGCHVDAGESRMFGPPGAYSK